MPTAFRLVKTKFAPTAYSGEGARLYGGRWNSPGTAVVYLAGSISLAMLEVLVHTEDVAILEAFSIGEVGYDEGLETAVKVKDLPATWKDLPAGSETQAIGDEWVATASSVLLKVPSVVADGEFNVLMNPAHPDVAKLVFAPIVPFRFDRRLTATRVRKPK